MGWLDPFKAALGGKVRGSAELVRDLEKARQAHADAVVRAAELAAELPKLLSTPDRLPAHHALAAAAEAQVREADALVAVLTERHAAAIAVEAEAARQAAHDRAVELVEQARTLMRRDYEKACELLAAIAGAVHAADLAVQAANRDLPAATSPLNYAEDGVRDLAGVAGGKVRARTEEGWVADGYGGHLDASAKVTETGHNVGVWDGPRGLTTVRRARFSIVVSRATVPGLRGSRIAQMLVPALRADDPAFIAWPHEPAALAKLRQAHSPSASKLPEGDLTEQRTFLEFLPTKAEAA